METEQEIARGAPWSHRGTPAVQRLVEFAPATGGLALWVHHRDVGVPRDGAAIFTDGTTLHYAPAFAELGLNQQTGWVAHEMLHIALRHPQRFAALRQLIGDADLPLFNLCADAIVNSALAELAWLTLPPGAMRLERLLELCLGLRVDAVQALLAWDVERLYRAIDDRAPRTGSGNAEQRRVDGPRAARARALGAGTARDLVIDPDTLAAPELEAEQAREWSERILRAHAGDGAFSMLRTLVADLPRTRTPWQQLLRVRLAHGLASRTTPSWSRPSRSWIANQGRAGPHRRMPWEPGISAVRPVPRLVVVIDVSGSIENALMEHFAVELEAIMRRLEAAMVVVIGDDQVREVRHWQPGQGQLSGIRFLGQGGTDFSPLLREADKYRPDMVVVLTDLQGPAEFRPRFPVLWAVPPAYAHAEPPFGRRLVLE